MWQTQAFQMCLCGLILAGATVQVCNLSVNHSNYFCFTQICVRGDHPYQSVACTWLTGGLCGLIKVSFGVIVALW